MHTYKGYSKGAWAKVKFCSTRLYIWTRYIPDFPAVRTTCHSLDWMKNLLCRNGLSHFMYICALKDFHYIFFSWQFPVTWFVRKCSTNKTVANRDQIYKLNINWNSASFSYKWILDYKQHVMDSWKSLVWVIKPDLYMSTQRLFHWQNEMPLRKSHVYRTKCTSPEASR